MDSVTVSVALVLFVSDIVALFESVGVSVALSLLERER